MQTFGLNYDVKPGRIDKFKEAFLQLIDTMHEFDGHIETRLFQDVAKPSSMMVYSNWATKAQFTDFFRSDAFQAKLKEHMNMLERKPTHFAGQNVRLIKPPE